MDILKLLQQRKLASAKAMPQDNEETLFERVSEKYKEKTPEVTKEASIKKTKLKPDVSDAELKAISTRQKAKMADYPEETEVVKPKNFRDLDERVIKRLKERDEEESILRGKNIPEWKIQERLKLREE